MKRQTHYFALSIASLFLAACGGSSQDRPQDENPITISFSAAPKYILASEPVALTWNAEDTSFCTISGVFETTKASRANRLQATEFSATIPVPTDPNPVTPTQPLAILPASGSTTVYPTESTSYSLNCTDSKDAVFSSELEIIISADADADQYPDALEAIVGTRSDDPDSDDDGLLDGLEDKNRNGMVDDGETSPTDPASRNPYYCDSVRIDNENNGLDVVSNCINPEVLAAGDRHVCLIMDNGYTRCWGRNLFSQLGRSGEDIGDDETAASGSTLYGLIQISAGDSTTCGVHYSGSVHCWGHGQYGVTGHGNELTSTFANARVDLPEPAIQVSTSGEHSCAVTETGKLYCWGHNSTGQLGYGNKEDIGDWESPASAGAVELASPVKQVSTGFGFTCALLVSGSVKCWGNPSQGTTGWQADYLTYGNYVGDDPGETPVGFPFVTLNGGATYEISSGRLHSCAMSVGAMTCWGQGAEGKLGYGFTDNVGDDELASAYGAVPYGGGEVTNIATGGSGSCVSLADGNARCWGAPTLLGGETMGDDEPASNAPDFDFGGKKSIYIARGGSFICALMRDQSVYCWGLNDSGQLGLGHVNPVNDALSGAVSYR